MQIWCENFLGGGTAAAPGACCRKDDDIALGWCTDAANEDDPRFSRVCDPTNPDFGEENWVVADGALRLSPGASVADAEADTGFCEVLGKVRCHQLWRAVGQCCRAVCVLLTNAAVRGGVLLANVRCWPLCAVGQCALPLPLCAASLADTDTGSCEMLLGKVPVSDRVPSLYRSTGNVWQTTPKQCLDI